MTASKAFLRKGSVYVIYIQCLKMHYNHQKKEKIITSREIDGETVADFIFLGSKSLQMVTAAVKLKDTCSLEEKLSI